MKFGTEPQYIVIVLRRNNPNYKDSSEHESISLALLILRVPCNYWTKYH